MKKLQLPLLLGLILLGCQDPPPRQTYDLDFIRSQITYCRTIPQEKSIASIFSFTSLTDPIEEIDHPRYLPAGKVSGLPTIVPNDNTRPAGIIKDDVLVLNLEAKWGDFRLETPDRPGLKMVAIGEVGKPATIPAPLVRVVAGTIINATIKNTLTDSTITVYGFQQRPFTTLDSLFILPGESGEVTFKAGVAGTYMYWLKLGKGHKQEMFGEEKEQLAGAFVVDPKEGSPPDRVFVMNIFSSKQIKEDSSEFWVEALTINGRSWPFTEMMKPAVGDTINWRVINASDRGHPMHLHGFYFDVLERGNTFGSQIFEKEQIPNVVTENMRGRSTMTMQWVPSRPGNWLFHCHLSFHVTSELRLPGAEDFDPEGSTQHMAGLVIGIQVGDGPSDLISKGAPKHMTLFANEKNENNVAFDLENSIPGESFKPGPLLLLKQFQTTNITVKNQMSTGTSIHWHGLEIDSWADGVPGWSSSDGRTSPIIEPGEEFTYKLSLMRPGTFVYHSHLDDIHQLTKGLYGPLIILGEDEVYNPDLDHVYILGWKTPDPKSAADLDLNGWVEVPVQQAEVGETHRIRLINIGPAGGSWIKVTKDGEPVLLKTIAKDGADLPLVQQRDVKVTDKVQIGETADYAFAPQEPGIYEMEFTYMGLARWQQTWKVGME